MRCSMEGLIDLPERQRTLHAAIDWSYHRLTDEPARTPMASSAVFSRQRLPRRRPGRSTAAASRSSPHLEALVGWSLIRTEASDGKSPPLDARDRPQFAIDRLRPADALDDVRTRHAEHFLELALAAETELSGEDQIDWLNRLEREYDNLTATLDWLLSSGRAEDALRAVSALERFWRAHAHVSEARRWLSLGLELATDVPADTRADALWAAARQAAGQSDWDAAVPLLEEALSLFRMRKRHKEEVFTLSELGYIALRRGDRGRGAPLSATQALAPRGSSVMRERRPVS